MATDGRIDGWTDETATICSPFWEHKNSSLQPQGRGRDKQLLERKECFSSFPTMFSPLSNANPDSMKALLFKNNLKFNSYHLIFITIIYIYKKNKNMMYC